MHKITEASFMNTCVNFISQVSKEVPLVCHRIIWKTLYGYTVGGDDFQWWINFAWPEDERVISYWNYVKIEF